MCSFRLCPPNQKVFPTPLTHACMPPAHPHWQGFISFVWRILPLLEIYYLVCNLDCWPPKIFSTEFLSPPPITNFLDKALHRCTPSHMHSPYMHTFTYKLIIHAHRHTCTHSHAHSHSLIPRLSSPAEKWEMHPSISHTHILTCTPSHMHTLTQAQLWGSFPPSLLWQRERR